ncbi:hypothetical protein NQ317_014613, partial [Molorchus minor]
GYTMKDIRYKWNAGYKSVGISSEVELPQFRVLGHRQRETVITLTTGFTLEGLEGRILFRGILTHPRNDDGDIPSQVPGDPRSGVFRNVPLEMERSSSWHWLVIAVGYTMRDIRYKWNEGPNSVGVSNEVSLPQFKVLGHRQRAMEISLTTGTSSGTW